MVERTDGCQSWVLCLLFLHRVRLHSTVVGAPCALISLQILRYFDSRNSRMHQSAHRSDFLMSMSMNEVYQTILSSISLPMHSPTSPTLCFRQPPVLVFSLSSSPPPPSLFLSLFECFLLFWVRYPCLFFFFSPADGDTRRRRSPRTSSRTATTSTRFSSRRTPSRSGRWRYVCQCLTDGYLAEAGWLALLSGVR